MFAVAVRGEGPCVCDSNCQVAGPSSQTAWAAERSVVRSSRAALVLDAAIWLIPRTGQPGLRHLPERGRWRTFTAKYKLELLAAYEAAPEGEKGALLRCEGLYSN